MLPMLVIPMVSYEFLIDYFKHYTVIYSGIAVGFMMGVILLLMIEKTPQLIKKIFLDKRKEV
jgi:hypothetical protein